MKQRREGGTIEKRNRHITGWRKLAALLGPSLLLLPVLVLYLSFKGTPHFFLHTLIGWDVALILLLVIATPTWVPAGRISDHADRFDRERRGNGTLSSYIAHPGWATGA